MGQYLTNTEILCFVLGWQGGTVYQVAKELQIKTADILEATPTRMGDLLRLAQSIAFKHQRDTTEALQILKTIIDSNGNWEEGCFYYNRTAAPELQTALLNAETVLKNTKN